MQNQEPKNIPNSVPEEVFKAFLSSLSEKEIAKGVVRRLTETIVEQGNVSEEWVREALFPKSNPGE